MKFYFKEMDTITKDADIKGDIVTSIDTTKINGEPRLISMWLNADIYLNEYNVYRHLKYAIDVDKPFNYGGEAVMATRMGDKIKFVLNEDETYIASSEFIRIFSEWMNHFKFEKRICIYSTCFDDEVSVIKYLQYMLDLPMAKKYTLEEIGQEMRSVDLEQIDIYCLSAMREKVGDLADRIFDVLMKGEKYGIKVSNMEPPFKKKA